MKSVPRPKAGLRWAIYSRISGREGASIGDDDDDTASLQTQEDGCKALIERLDPTGTIVDSLVLREIHTGVELFTRPKLTRLREAVRRGEVDAIACYQPKRWTRDPDHAGYLQTELRDHRVMLRFAVDDPGDGEAGALVGYVQHWSGKQEHNDITERTHRARSKLVQLGQAWVGCKAPYGLRWIYETIQLPNGRVKQKAIGWEAEPSEAAVITGLFTDLLKGGSVNGMARALTNAAVRSPKGGTIWWPSVVKDLLQTRLYTGEAYGLQHVRDTSDEYIGVRGKSAGRRKCRTKLRPDDEWVKLPDGYAPSLIDSATFEAAQQVLARRRPGGRAPADPTATLMAGGRARCSDCGYVMARCGRKRANLSCSGRAAPRYCASRPSIQMRELDDAAKRLARLIYENPEVIAEQAELHRANDPTEADLATVERRLADIERQQHSLTLVASRITDPDAAAPLVVQLEALAGQKRTAERDRAEFLERRAGWEETRQFLDGFADLAARVSEHLDTYDHARWQRAIDALGITAAVRPVSAPERYTLTTRLEAVLTADLIRALAEQDGCLKYGTSASCVLQTPLTLTWCASQLRALMAG